MRVLSVHEQEPNFPASDSAPGAMRYRVAGLWVDALDGEPTEAEVLRFLGRDATTAEQRRIDAEIAKLEASITERRKREALLTDSGRAWLAAKDAEIAALRAQRPK